MSDPEVDRVRAAYARRAGADRYDNRRPEVVAGSASRARAWGAALLARDHALGTVVEIGAGPGGVLRWAAEVGATLAIGIDLQPDRLVELRARNPVTPAVLADGRFAPVRSGAVDTILCATLFSSVLDDGVAAAMAAEIGRVLRPGGAVLWYDLRRRNPSNQDVRATPARLVASWFPGYAADLRPATLAPPFARRAGRWTGLALVLEAFPPLRTHLAGILVKPDLAS